MCASREELIARIATFHARIGKPARPLGHCLNLFMENIDLESESSIKNFIDAMFCPFLVSMGTVDRLGLTSACAAGPTVLLC